MQEFRDVVVGEGGVLLAQGLQGNGRFFDDLEAVGAGNPLLFGDAVGDVRRQVRGVLAFLGNADLTAGDEVELLGLVGAMIDCARRGRRPSGVRW